MVEQILLAESAEAQARRDFQDAIRNFFGSANKDEQQRETAVDRLHQTRGILVIEFAYSLEQLVEVVEMSQ